MDQTRRPFRPWQIIARLKGAGRAGLLAQTRLAGPMPWVIAIMIFLMTVAASGALALNAMAQNARAELAGGLTVQIVEAGAEQREVQTQEAMALLADWPGISHLRRVPAEELDALVAPWLGKDASGNAAGAVPVPALIDARLEGAITAERLTELRAALVQVAPAVRVDAQSGWLQPVFSALQSLQWLALALIGLLAVATSAAVWLAARNALGANRETIEVVHHLGGTDAQIAATFQRSVAFDAALGGGAGFAVGLGAAYLLGSRFAVLESGIVASGSLGWADWGLVAIIPLVGVVLAMLTARLTVLAALRRML